MAKHIFIEHPVTGECIVCKFKLHNSVHFFVRFPTSPVNSLYNQSVAQECADGTRKDVEMVENKSEKLSRCEACE